MQETHPMNRSHPSKTGHTQSMEPASNTALHPTWPTRCPHSLTRETSLQAWLWLDATSLIPASGILRKGQQGVLVPQANHVSQQWCPWIAKSHLFSSFAASLGNKQVPCVWSNQLQKSCKHTKCITQCLAWQGKPPVIPTGGFPAGSESIWNVSTSLNTGAFAEKWPSFCLALITSWQLSLFSTLMRKNDHGLTLGKFRKSIALHWESSKRYGLHTPQHIFTKKTALHCDTYSEAHTLLNLTPNQALRKTPTRRDTEVPVITAPQKSKQRQWRTTSMKNQKGWPASWSSQGKYLDGFSTTPPGKPVVQPGGKPESCTCYVRT